MDEKNEYMILALMRITRPEVHSPSADQLKHAVLCKDDSDGVATGSEATLAKDSNVSDASPEANLENDTLDPNTATTITKHMGARREPLRLIHVVFGLCLEILAKTSSTGSSSSAAANSQSSANLSAAANDSALQGCLGALNSILSPVFLQQEFLGRVFLEMMTILERVAWMEGSRVQCLVLGVISTMIQGYGEDLLFADDKVSTTDAGIFSSADSSDADAEAKVYEVNSTIDTNVPVSKTPGSRLRSIVQLLVELYIQKCSGSSSKFLKAKTIVGGRVGQKSTMETVELLGKVTDMLTGLLKVAPPEYQLHLAAVSLNVFVGELHVCFACLLSRCRKCAPGMLLTI